MSFVAHNFDEKHRTDDVQIQENVDFSAMLLSNKILTGLRKCGFKKPSPIQLKAIPMGRCGFDLIVKAKSGTGKTAVFGITALEMVNVENNSVQVLILAPTREIAVQIQHVIKNIGSELIGLNVQYFIGGTPILDDEKKLENCHIAVGAPGRIKHLIDKQCLDVSHVKLFILDEADKLLENSYQADINKIYHKLPVRKQVIAASATYPNNLDEFLSNYMISPMHVSPDAKVPCLLGLKQFYVPVRCSSNVIFQMKTKTEELTKILSNLSFNQCLIFSNFQSRAESLSNLLRQEGWPCLFISGNQDQKTRLQVVDSLRDFKCRILSSTDLTARGIDAANVDLVVNYDVPHDVESYLHRMGRAGRYGSYGMCVTIASEGQELMKLEKIISTLGPNVAVGKLPDKITSSIWESDVDTFPQLNVLNVVDERKETVENDVDVVTTTNDVNGESSINENGMNETQDGVNEKLFNTAISQLTELLRLNKCDDQDGKNSVATILKVLKLRNRLDQNTFYNNHKNMDSTELLGGIENISKRIKLDEHTDFSNHRSCELQDNKRIKLDERGSTSEVIKNPECTDGKLQRNIALFTITKCLSGRNESKENCLKCINDLLKMVKMEDEINKQNSNLEEFKINNLRNNERNREQPKINKSSNETNLEPDNVQNRVVSCQDFECIENQVVLAYKYALSGGNTPHWDTICLEHKNGLEYDRECEEKLFDPKENLIEDESNLTYDEFEEESTENLYEMESEDNVGLGEWENIEDNDADPLVEQFIESEIDENLVSEAYKKALRGDFRRISHVHTDDENQPFGFAVDTSYTKKKFINFTPTSTKSLEKITDKRNLKKKVEPVLTEPEPIRNQTVDSPLNDFVTRRNRYKQYFRHHGTVLRETAPTFDSVEDFQNWYRTWLQSLETLRQFVQQDVYEKEFRRKT